MKNLGKMNSRANKIKFEVFIARKAFRGKRLFVYLYNRFWLARKIYKNSKLKELLSKKEIRDDLSIHVLTGNLTMTMFLWSLSSYYLNASALGELYIHGDGTLSKQNKKTIKEFFPFAIFVDNEDVFRKDKSNLYKYKLVEKFRRENPDFIHGYKFIDAYFLSDKKYHLVIDCDILWYKKPSEIDREIERGGDKSFMTRDPNEYPVHFKDRTKFGAGINSGIDFYRKTNLSMDKFTEFLERMDMNHQSKHFIEQAGFAYCLENLEILPVERYSIKGGVTSETVSKHYVGPRREMFFVGGVRLLKKKLLSN